MARSKTQAKRSFTCNGGPMHDQTLYLASASTLEFSYNGQRGRYVGTNGFGPLNWESYDEDGTRPNPG